MIRKDVGHTLTMLMFFFCIENDIYSLLLNGLVIKIPHCGLLKRIASSESWDFCRVFLININYTRKNMRRLLYFEMCVEIHKLRLLTTVVRSWFFHLSFNAHVQLCSILLFMLVLSIKLIFSGTFVICTFYVWFVVVCYCCRLPRGFWVKQRLSNKSVKLLFFNRI